MTPNKGHARRITLALLAAMTLATSGCCVLGPFGGGVCFPGGPGGGGGGGRDGGGGGHDGGRGDGHWRLNEARPTQGNAGQR